MIEINIREKKLALDDAVVLSRVSEFEIQTLVYVIEIIVRAWRLRMEACYER